MESLPADLLYFSRSIAGYSKNVIKLNTQNATSLSSTGATQLRVSLPTNTLCSLKSLSMHATMSTNGIAAVAADSNVYALIPRGGIGAVLDRVSWSLGGVATDSGPAPYNIIHMMKQNLEKSVQKNMSDDGMLNASTIQTMDLTDAYAISNRGQTRDLVQNHFLGFTEAHPTYFDLSLVPEMVLTLQVSSAAEMIPVQFHGSALGAVPTVVNTNFGTSYYGSGCTYSLDNVYFTMQVVSIGSGMFNELMARVLAEKGTIDVPYKSYQLISQSQSSPAGSIRGSVSTMSLDGVYALQRNSVETAPAAPTAKFGGASYVYQQPPLPAEGNYGYGFTQAAHCFTSLGVSTNQITVNNSPYPMWSATPTDTANLAVVSNNRTYSNVAGGLVGSLNTWLYHAYTFFMRLNHNSDVTLVSGMNLSSINAQISFQATTDGISANQTARQSSIITEATSLLRVGPSRSVAVVS
tara:strand:+ start:346 stop:1740 length:1395 start_codon:yes stop_codon:yes gene_type:complete